MIGREIRIFLIVGSLTVGVDFLTYRGLLGCGLDYAAAKGIGFIAGTIFAYFANKLWTFGHVGHKRGAVWRFGILYGLTLLANIGCNALALTVLSGAGSRILLAFLFATGVSATLNFLGMKFFVFPPLPAAS